MSKLTPEDLDSIETYRQKRPAVRAAIMEHKINRRIALGPNVTLHFEDRMTMRYQVQEMLRAENITDTAEIHEELETYNALIPDGSNWKATLMIEFEDEAERQVALRRLVGIENKIWIQAGDHARVFPIADEDLERTSDDGKTSAVHFLRFELNDEMIRSLQQGAVIRMGCDHAEYPQEIRLEAQQQQSLLRDLDAGTATGKPN